MRNLVLCIAFIVGGVPAWADAQLSVLVDVLEVDEVTQIMKAEGENYAQTLNEEMLDEQGGAFWLEQIDAIYDVQRMQETVRAALEVGLSDTEIAQSVAFFASERGVQIITLENAARRAMDDQAVEDAARLEHARLQGSDDPHYALVQDFVATNDLLERNVSGALSANLQFYSGLADGRLLQKSESEILADVWADEPNIREDTEGWLFGYLLLAYQPLSGEDLEAYVAFSQSPAGQALNAALFDGYETMYRDISYALGRAVALSAVGNDI